MRTAFRRSRTRRLVPLAYDLKPPTRDGRRSPMAHTRHETRSNQPGTSMHHAAAHAAPDMEHERLDAFIGKWHMEGQQLAGPAGPAASISALQTYEWLDGGQFLIHRFDGHVGD